jgi:cell division septation protein DedD
LRQWIVPIGLAVGLAGRVDAGPLEQGAARYAAGDGAGARALWQPLADAGNADALFDLAQLYRNGRGVPADRSYAEDLLRRAAAKGHAAAQTLLGHMKIEDGNMAEAARWLAPAALAGDPDARFLIGTLYANGDGVERDPILAFAYLSAARDGGVARAGPSIAILEKTMSDDDLAKARVIAARLVHYQAETAATVPGAPKRLGAPARAQAVKEKPVASAGKGRPAAPAHALPTDATWRVQLGAFSSHDKAAEAWAGIVAKTRATLRTARPIYVPAGPVVRLQIAGGPDRKDSVYLCEALRQHKQDCIVVRP